MQKKYLFGFLALLLPLSMLAHPGHGQSEGFTITHYFVEPIHVISFISLLVVVIIGIRWKRNRNKMQPHKYK